MAEACHCGKPLHYASAERRAEVERLIEELGANITVCVGFRRWLVPRHYIALHGLKASSLPGLGFPEIDPEQYVLRT